MNPFRPRLSARLLIVVLVALAPAIAAIALTQSVTRERARQRTLTDTLRLVRLAASQQADVFDGARRLLLTLGEFPPLRASGPRVCDATLPNVLGAHPGFVSLAVANADGTLVGAGVPPERRASLWLLGIVSVMGIAAALIGAHVFVLKPVRALKVVTDRIAAGDLSARAQLTSSVAGIGGLGNAVNAMADALDAREHEREDAVRKLRESEDRCRLLFDQNPHPMWVYDAATLAVLEVNDVAVQRYGYSRAEFLAMRTTDLGDPDALPQAETLAPAPVQEPSGSQRHRVKSGEIIDVEIASHGAVIAGRPAVVITAQDITARARAEGALAERVALTTVSAEVGSALNRPGELSPGLQSCAEAIVAHLDLAEVRIWVIHPTTGVLVLEATAGSDRRDQGCEPDHLAAGGPAIARIAQERRRHLTNDLAGDPTAPDRDWALCEGIVAFAGWPLVVADRAVGVMALFARDRLSEGVVAGLTSVSALLALGITRHQSEDARRLLAAIVASSDDAIVGASPSGIILSWNAGAARLFGYSEAEAVGRPVWLLQPPDGDGEVQELIRQLIHGGHVNNREAICQRQDGSLVPVSLTLSPITDEAGVVTGLSAILRDITERRRAEERMRLLAGALESTNEMVSVTDTNDRITFVNAAYLRAYGYTADEVLGHTPALVQSSQTPAAVIEDIARESRLGGWKGEVRNRRRDGTEFFISLNTSAVRDDRGEIIGLLGVARDISERLHAEVALRDAEERMRFALEASHVGVWEASLKTGVAFFSETCETMHGLAPGTFGRTYAAFVDRIHPDDRAAALQQIERAIRDHERAELEYRTLGPDHCERRISTVAHFSFDGDGRAVRAAGVAVDVTERRSLEDQLRQSQKMDAIGQLAGGIAHDFNNLLTVIQGFAGFLAESLPEPDERHADVEEILHAASRAAALTRQLLAFSRKQILAVRVLHIGDIVSELTPMLRRLLGESIDLRTIVGDRGLTKIDPGQLHQVIINLAVNARDAMPHGGQLTLQTSDVVLDEAFARLHPSVRPGPHVLIAVTDTGHGMDEATAKRIFEPFFTTKPMGQGTGLGLATVYGIVKQSDGSIWVDSEIGRGTTFTVYLPETDEVEEAVRSPPVQPSALGGAETVLLVEDEDVVREFVYKVLSRRGYNVHAVDDPAKALDYAQAQKASIDLVLSDIILPNMSGQAMVTRMQPGHPESRVLYMSGYTDHAIVHQGILVAGTAFLQKPFSAEALSKKVRDVLDA